MRLFTMMLLLFSGALSYADKSDGCEHLLAGLREISRVNIMPSLLAFFEVKSTNQRYPLFKLSGNAVIKSYLNYVPDQQKVSIGANVTAIFINEPNDTTRWAAFTRTPPAWAFLIESEQAFGMHRNLDRLGDEHHINGEASSLENELRSLCEATSEEGHPICLPLNDRFRVLQNDIRLVIIRTTHEGEFSVEFSKSSPNGPVTKVTSTARRRLRNDNYHVRSITLTQQ